MNLAVSNLDAVKLMTHHKPGLELEQVDRFQDLASITQRPVG